MDLSSRLEALLTAAESIGIEIRAEPMDGSSGGLCRLKNRLVLFVDTTSDLATRYDDALSALAPLTELDEHFLAPALREDLEQRRAELQKSAGS